MPTRMTDEGQCGPDEKPCALCGSPTHTDDMVEGYCFDCTDDMAAEQAGFEAARAAALALNPNK